jgi:hypothetical protein
MQLRLIMNDEGFIIFFVTSNIIQVKQIKKSVLIVDKIIFIQIHNEV